MARRSFKQFVEQELGQVPKFFIYALLEWMMILILFIDGFLAFFANEFAKFFELPVPCLFCTRIDHIFVRRDVDFYYNDSICEHHKKNVSSLAFCHAHKKLTDIRNMCESCLLSFATEKESDCHTYKSLLGILHKDIELLVDDDHDEVHLSLPAGKKDDDNETGVVVKKSNDRRCSCCGEPLKVKSSYVKGKTNPNPNPIPIPNFSTSSSSSLPSSALAAPAPSPNPNLRLSHVKYTEVKLNSEDSEAQEHDNEHRSRGFEKSYGEDGKGATLMDGDDEDKTPTFIRGNKFFGIPLSDSANNTPRWTRISRKSMLERSEFASESGEGQVGNDAEGDMLHHLKRQVRMDRKSLMSLYMELDEERSASAVAANNAMAMITRLQAEKAAVQMEALQYQRMMEEQAEYDQEAIQELSNLLTKREEEIKDLEAELEAYRQNYGVLKEELRVGHQNYHGHDDGDGDDDHNHDGHGGYHHQVTDQKPSNYSSISYHNHNHNNVESIIHHEKEKSSSAQYYNSHIDSMLQQQQQHQGREVGEAEAIERPKRFTQGRRPLDRLKILDKKHHIKRADEDNDDDDTEDDTYEIGSDAQKSRPSSEFGDA